MPGEQLSVVMATTAAADSQQAGKTGPTTKKRKSDGNTPEPDSIDERKAR